MIKTFPMELDGAWDSNFVVLREMGHDVDFQLLEMVKKYPFSRESLNDYRTALIQTYFEIAKNPKEFNSLEPRKQLDMFEKILKKHYEEK